MSMKFEKSSPEIMHPDLLVSDNGWCIPIEWVSTKDADGEKVLIPKRAYAYNIYFKKYDEIGKYPDKLDGEKGYIRYGGDETR